MLKRLELVGFKSFADKTQFDFAAGITGVVGPNGSGKSNVVDAVRWILGEQSAKSLRGGEMADVIFNGSTSRRSLGLAEVTMTFDNGNGHLATQAGEVQITRRVYRSGEGEYLINQQPSRLRDIKDLFLGTGAGSDAYCIIEQGRVDVLLQASTRERRTIFEEAAGISRFKAKKIETLRKLERVDLNLSRLKDIIDEVEKQLRSVKLQAAKAQRYQEYSDRLKELRLGLGLQEYHELAERLHVESAALEILRSALEQQLAQAETWEAEIRQPEAVVSKLDGATLEQMRRAARLQNDAVSFKAQVDNLRREHERLRLRSEQAAKSLATIDLELQELTAADEALQGRLTTARQAQVDHRQERDQLRKQVEEVHQFGANLRAERSGLSSRIEVLEGLERSHEGLGTGVREMIALLESPDPGPWRAVVGMTADFLTVRREYAHLIDLALGERAQRFLVRDAKQLAEALASRTE